MSFLEALKKNDNRTKTTNGAGALKSTCSGLVDLFGSIGAMRHREAIDIENKFAQAFSEDRLLAMKLLFYARDIRGGLGERRTARVVYKHLACQHPIVLKKNLKQISYYGRWDDLWVLLDTELSDAVVEIVRGQLEADLVSETPSLLAKWLPSHNTSSKTTRRYAKILMRGLNWDAKSYRQTLSALRRKIDVLEAKMSSRQWGDIAYSQVPANAMSLYSKAFCRNDEKRFKAYIESVKTGDEKVNASVLYPYNITEKMLYDSAANYELLEQQWYSMPDFVEGHEKNVLVMADVSGSMTGRPMATSIGLALYFAERSKGAFANHFMTFSASPSVIQVTGETLYEKVRCVLNSDWGMNTNFESALELILRTAVENRLPASDLPEVLAVVSDMQFDGSLHAPRKGWTFYSKMKRTYAAAGYRIPEIVFWNVNSPLDAFQASMDCEGVKLVSGQSASVFKCVLRSQTATPYDFLLEVLNSERYSGVVA